jgi:hypothetical protein
MSSVAIANYIEHCFRSAYPTKLVTLSTGRLNETHSKVHMHEYFFDPFPVQNGLKQGHGDLFHCF